MRDWEGDREEVEGEGLAAALPTSPARGSAPLPPGAEKRWRREGLVAGACAGRRPRLANLAEWKGGGELASEKGRGSPDGAASSPVPRALFRRRQSTEGVGEKWGK